VLPAQSTHDKFAQNIETRGRKGTAVGEKVPRTLSTAPEEDVALASDVFGARQERKMLRAGNRDLKYYAIAW